MWKSDGAKQTARLLAVICNSKHTSHVTRYVTPRRREAYGQVARRHLQQYKTSHVTRYVTPRRREADGQIARRHLQQYKTSHVTCHVTHDHRCYSALRDITTLTGYSTCMYAISPTLTWLRWECEAISLRKSSSDWSTSRFSSGSSMLVHCSASSRSSAGTSKTRRHTTLSPPPARLKHVDTTKIYMLSRQQFAGSVLRYLYPSVSRPYPSP